MRAAGPGHPGRTPGEGMTQADLSAAAGVSRPQISIIESGLANPDTATQGPLNNVKGA